MACQPRVDPLFPECVRTDVPWPALSCPALPCPEPTSPRQSSLDAFLRDTEEELRIGGMDSGSVRALLQRPKTAIDLLKRELA